MRVTFLLNGESVEVAVADPTVTVLDWLRETRGLKGTKEGCNEGDCGACTVMVTDESGARALNACILFLPQIHGKALRTVEGIAAPDGTLHPVQETMITHHGSQCGFCTPGFIVAMATGHLNGAQDHGTELAGNLCRCTGYAPILRAARAAEDAPAPDHLKDAINLPTPAIPSSDSCAVPQSSDALAEWYLAHPDATLIAGATDVGLWVNKDFRELGHVAFLNRCKDLKGIEVRPKEIRIGAATTLSEIEAALSPDYPSLGALMRRYGAKQVRNAATIGGNIANGSPIGDGTPALIALGARLHLRKGNVRRDLLLEDYFIEYGKQDRSLGEFVEAVSFPKAGDHLHCYKLSKRFDQDISAVCGCFWLRIENAHVVEVRLAFGGMAGTPKRASVTESVLLNAIWSQDTVQSAMTAMVRDFSPLDDMRAGAAYRMQSAQNMLMRAYHDSQGIATNVLEVRG